MMPRQRMRCPKCRHEFVAETPAREGRFVITCPSCNFRSTVTIRPPVAIPSAVLDSEIERHAQDRAVPPERAPPAFEEVTDAPFQRRDGAAGTAGHGLAGDRPPPWEPLPTRAAPPPPAAPDGADGRKVTMKPLTHGVRPRGRRRREKAEGGRAPPPREGEAVRAIVPPPPPAVVPYTLEAAFEDGRLTFRASGREGRLSGVQRSPEVVSFSSGEGEELAIEVIDPHVAVFRFLGRRNQLMAFMYEKLTGGEKTLFLQFPDGRMVSMRGLIEIGPGGYRFDLDVADDRGGAAGRCEGYGKGFDGSARFEGDIGAPLVTVGALAALHLIGSLG